MDVELGNCGACASGVTRGHDPLPRQAKAEPAAAAPAAESGGDIPSGSVAPSRAMRALKVAMLLLLLAAAGVGAGVAFTLGRASELHSFHLQFEASVVQLQADAQARLDTLVKTAVMGAKYISSLPDVGGGGGVNIPGFRTFGEDLQAVSGATLSAWIMLVTDEQRPAFEAAAADAAARLDPSGALAAQVAATGIRQGAIGEARLEAPAFVRAPAAPLYAAVWAYSPRSLPHADYFLFNPYAEPLRHAAMDAVRATSAPAMTDLAPYTFGDEISSSAPSSVIFAPAWPDHDANTTYGVGVSASVPPPAPGADANSSSSSLGRAICSTSFHWETLLARALPLFIDSLVAVLRSPSGVEYTFQVAGRSVRGVGAGDRHAALVGDGDLARRERRVNLTVAGATWSLAVYPTRQLRGHYLTGKPRDNAAGIAAAVLACALLFGFYEFYDRQRAVTVNRRLLAYVRQLERMARELEEGVAREAEAQAAILAAVASSKEKDYFVAMVSHEIRTPLNAVSGATALLAGTRLDGEQRELVALLEAGTAHVVLIVEDILLHGALASGTFPVKREPLALAAAVLQPAWRMVSMQHAQRDKVATLRVTRTVDAAVPAVLLGDATRLTQVLTNLLGNSVKFTPAGGSIHLQVSVVTDDEDGAAEQHAAAAPEAASRARWLRFQVRDTGIGLAAGDVERVFMPFVQAQQTTVRQYGGTGLGLTICRRIARALGGDLTAASEGLGAGCSLTFTVPLCVPPPGDAAAAALPALLPAPHQNGRLLGSPPAETLEPPETQSPPSPASSASPSASMSSAAGAANILVAEDDLLSQAVMRKVLSRLGLRFTLVGDGAAAVEAYAQGCYDAVLMDLHMPIMDGLSAARAIGAMVASGERPYAPIVALTASCSDEERARCAAAGMAELLPKPISLVKVQELLQRHTRCGAHGGAAARSDSPPLPDAGGARPSDQ